MVTDVMKNVYSARPSLVQAPTALTDVTKNVYRQIFTTNSNPFISEGFIGLVEKKVDKIVRLIDERDHSIGLVAGVKDNIIYSPFSAPFGGFHYSHEQLLYDKVFSFVSNLKEFVEENMYKRVVITLPPDLYQKNMNAKLVNALIRLGYTMNTPEIENWINLKEFNGTWVTSRITQNCRKAIKNNLSFIHADTEITKQEAYTIIFENRENQRREIYMRFADLMKVDTVIPVDFFLVKDNDGHGVGAGVFYRGHKKIIQGIFLGDNIEKRSLGIMDFLIMKLYNFYKDLGYEYIDLGRSSKDGEPNEGLIRFKEIHNCVSTLRYTFSWDASNGL